ncbi:MAG: SDR family NAD(P)-dependent oxidoreductase [Deltaproteobacteria bacterium]|jgi:short-subunit dehydrogenase|nr:SDR family NAD(P)-dependent oxidoreductase [Deltaproteobacteria bacterium]
MTQAPAPAARRTALITGASSGIGEASARALAAAGFEVALVARRGDLLERIAKEIEKSGGRAFALAADLADETETARVFDQAMQALGRLDLIVNNAGYSPGAAIEQMSRSEIRQVFEVNLLSSLQLLSLSIPVMREQGGGRIINIGSVAGAIPAPLAIPYAATKVGMHAASDALRLEVAPFGIQVSTIIPGFVDTAVFDNAREAAGHLRDDPTNPYRKTFFDLDDLAKKNLRNALSPADVARIVVRAATARRPKERYYTPFTALLQIVFMRNLPARALDWLLSRVYKLDRR